MAARLWGIKKGLPVQHVGNLCGLYEGLKLHSSTSITWGCNLLNGSREQSLGLPRAEDAVCNLVRRETPSSIRNLCSVAHSGAKDKAKLKETAKETQVILEEEISESIETGDAESKAPSIDEVAVDSTDPWEEISAGDLSDCPPALHEFVFTSPHPMRFTVDPEHLQPSQVKAVIRTLLERRKPPNDAQIYVEPSKWCAKNEGQTERGEEKWLQYPEPNTLWPNPLLHNHRLQPFTCVAGGASAKPATGQEGEIPKVLNEGIDTGNDDAQILPGGHDINKLQLHLNRLRLEQLWKYSGVHGISWDEIDEVYLSFRKEQQRRQKQWESRKQQILEYAGVVCARRLREQRLQFVKSAGADLDSLDEETREQLLVPRSLFRRMTRKLFYKWHDEYFAPWRPGGLQEVLKAHITLRMLERETHERFMHLEPSLTPTRDSNEGQTEKRAKSSLEQPSETTRGRMELEEELRSILRRPYVQKAVGSRRGKQSSRTPHTSMSQEADVDRLNGAEEAVDRPWDFVGVGRRGRRVKLPSITATKE